MGWLSELVEKFSDLRNGTSVTHDKSGHETSNNLNTDTEGKRGNVKKKSLSLLRGIASLDCGTIDAALSMLLLSSLPLKRKQFWRQEDTSGTIE